MVTVQEVFDMAIHLMDEQRETDGSTMTVDTGEYKYRTISILNTVIPRIAKYSRLEEEDEDDIPLLSNLNYKNPNFTQAIRLDDGLAMSLLPPYLAAELLSAENDTLSAWFMNQYREALNDMRNNADGSFEPIPLPYGTF